MLLWFVLLFKGREKEEFSNNFQETVQRNIRRDRPQEERVFWVLATDIQQSAV